MESIFFVLVLLYVQTVLFLITLRGYKPAGKPVRWRFLLLHAGLLLAVGAGFWGCPDSMEYRMKLQYDEVSREAFRLDGTKTSLSYDVELQSLETEYSEDGRPIRYEAVLQIDDNDPVTVCVNDPYPVRIGEDIYLASVSENHCVLQIVREPWRYFALVGILMLLSGAFLLFINGPRKS